MIDVLTHLDRTASVAGERYTMISGSFTGEAQRAMIGEQAFSASASRALKKTLTRIGVSALDTEDDIADREIGIITENARTVASMHLGTHDPRNDPKSLTNAVRDSEQHSLIFLSNEIAAQLSRDVNQTLKRYRNASLRAVMKSDVEMINRKSANEAVLIEEMKADKQLHFMDRSGRRVKNSTHIHRIYRQTLRDHWMQVYLQTTASYGVSEVAIWHPDRSNKYYGDTIKASEYEFGLDDISKAFHPNSRALPMVRSYMEASQ